MAENVVGTAVEVAMEQTELSDALHDDVLHVPHVLHAHREQILKQSINVS